MPAERIPVTSLKPGMYVLNPGISWITAPLLYMREGIVADQNEVDGIIQQGFTETIHDPERSVPCYEPGCGLPRVFSQHLAQAQRAHAAAFAHVKATMTSARCDSADISGAGLCVKSIILALNQNANAMLTLANLKGCDEYTYRHSVNVAIFAVAFARHLGLTDQQQQLAGMAGLFHDYGKALVPREILNAPRTLSPAEFSVMRSHALLGYDALRKIPHIAPEILEGAIQHHEMYDGLGYPYGLKGLAIGLFGRIISICDIYDALSSRRVYKAAICPSHALAIMYKMNGTAWPRGFADSFIRMMGVFPLGTAVKLSDGRMGLISSSNPDFPTRPTVIIVRKSRGVAYMEDRLDLSAASRICVSRALSFKETEDWDIPRLLGITE